MAVFNLCLVDSWMIESKVCKKLIDNGEERQKPLKPCKKLYEMQGFISMQIASYPLINNVFIEKQPFALSKWWNTQHFGRWIVWHAGVILLLLLSIYWINYVFRKKHKSQMQSKQNTETNIYFNYMLLKCVLFNIFQNWWLIVVAWKTKLSIKYYIIMSCQHAYICKVIKQICITFWSHFIPLVIVSFSSDKL